MFRPYMTGTTRVVDIYTESTDYNVNIDMESEGDKHFVFTQRVASDIWLIDHYLQKYPSVTVVDSAGSVVIGEITYLTQNSLIVTFLSPFSGKAYLN